MLAFFQMVKRRIVQDIANHIVVSTLRLACCRFKIPNVPHDIPPPITLIVDLESTLVSSTWDRKHGWRHAKRPGVDQFLYEMGQHFELVVFTPTMDAIAHPVVHALDPRGFAMHRLFRDATYYKNGVHIKDLSCLNRNLKRVIVLDDDPEEVKFHPQNLIRIKPFTDPTDFSDRSLVRIIPFLIELARADCQDIPAALAQYRGMDADQIADAFEQRLIQYKNMREKHLNRGVVGLFMKKQNKELPAPELPPVDPYLTVTPSITSKDLVGPAPNDDLEKPGLLGFFNRRLKAKEESQQLKIQKANEYFMQRHEKMEAEKKAREQASQAS